MNNHTHLGSIVGETIGPNEVEVIFELAFRLVLFLFDFLEHCSEIHWVRDDYY